MSFFNIRGFTSKNRLRKVLSNGSFNSSGSSVSSPKLLYLSPTHLEASLVKGNFKNIVTLPKYVDQEEWLASNVFDFFNNINLFYGAVSDYCNHRNCPVMSADAGIEYMWTDTNRRQMKLPASQYIDYVMTYVQNLMDDESMFPTKSANAFPPNFIVIIKGIFKQLFRVFAHIFHAHYDVILHLHAEPHLHSLFAHFISFSKEFDLLDKKDISPLQELVSEMEVSAI
ncbi:hypothetical protein CONCODRAFT_81627 [Conidiobolus coronatus NRRL 28638]|uniref:Mob1/phocein n=1 Tax=Conidiobolus coronatus (strain ATCC 28846 / CBS 209.66 / NRRL 28638) TaxID=796925 RepID=A0A137P8Q2_CONC2|nr:hypothetical protein CONCODRAFT_81627 [Conidiobolus coronatus NRRL 28638]|eukprot:KXN71387.1 hypothetical protein CONCODRAFT_81627 [Conidiobolus coronatus NRRL 28638]